MGKAMFVIAALALAAVTATSAAAGSRESVGRTETLVAVSEFVRSRSIDVAPTGNSAGDQVLAKDRLVNETSRERVGGERRVCTQHLGGDVCLFTFEIAGRGQIVASGFIADGEPGSLPTVSVPIVGGDGDFAGVGGELTVEFREADFRFTFELTP